MYEYKGDPTRATDRALHDEMLKVIEEDLDLWRSPLDDDFMDDCPPHCICPND